MVNGLVLLYLALFQNFGLSIVLFTVLVRLATLPLTVRQTRQMRAMSQLQPRLKEIQKRHANDRQRISQETFRMYREQGVNPIGCLGPMVVQMPIWIGLYWSLIKLLPSNPENLADLAGVLYSGLDMVHRNIPINSAFLGLDLASPATTPILPILVGGSMWLQQKMMTLPNADPRQQQSQRMMLWMFPLMFGFFTFSFPSGLALYWIASNLIGVAIQYKITGWGGLRSLRPSAEEAPASAEVPAEEPVEEQEEHGQHRTESENRRRSRRAGAKATRRRARGGRGRGR